MATSDVRYWVNHVRRCSCLAANMEKSRLNWKLKISNTADIAGIYQSQSKARDTRYRRMQEINSLCVSK